MFSKKKKYYELLGISKDAGIEEIQSAYNERVSEHHPEINPSWYGTKQAQQLLEAFRALRDKHLVGESGGGTTLGSFRENLGFAMTGIAMLAGGANWILMAWYVGSLHGESWGIVAFFLSPLITGLLGTPFFYFTQGVPWLVEYTWLAMVIAGIPAIALRWDDFKDS